MGTVGERLAGRWLGGVLALLGVLLVVPSLLAPTRELTVADREHGSLLSRQWEWSWGRVRLTGLEGVELQDEWNPLGLAVLVVLLLVALAGVTLWLARRVTWGHLLGLVSVGLLAGRVLTTVADRLGRSLNEVDQGAAGLTVRTEMTRAGSLETAAAGVLVVALVLMLVAVVRSTAGAGVSRLPGLLGPPDGQPVDRAAAARTPVRRPEPAGLRPDGERLTTAPVSFDDAGGAGAGRGTDPPAPAGKRGRTP
jgi:hypothetical protein